MAISLRRSRRAPKKGVSDFNVGDIVEVDRQHGIIARGRLAQLLTEGPSANPRWLIKFDSQPHKDEEMYERAFGKLLVDSNAEETEEKEQQQSYVMAPDLANSGSGSKVSTNPANSTAAGNTIGKGGSAPGEGEKSDDAKKGKRGSNSSVSSSAGATTSKTTTNSKEVQFQQSGGSGSNDLSDDSSSGGKGRYRSTADRASAREARSKRRQAQIDETRVAGGTDILAGGKRRLPPPPGGNSKKYKFNEPQYAEDGEVVKVKLLTGTLYLHRGQNRRVEFVRRV
ncbi:hypothetical protein FRACYDRAFT_271403 [Fragilariopsis cylindrus CCMP1102]|uniref:Uncharacterized protein n=1 Tax=Fragilariopsis cylindrus CCMP1102 TaxID=635003 RepID=A0A1E7EUU8_9STRA|nr:hypothetical protein FRACYDRAFT_271403 [Fragilariopsis cylindrus CCMP1102]|eukprot:OEU09627.1 hypothetical protein FRACYDRAFT_271403 [Fragilariopsis cylindrus CCMP1102]